jgi:antitoxin CptB
MAVAMTAIADERHKDVYIPAIMPEPDDNIRRKRLLFRSWHRGTREADLILGSFADSHLAGFTAAQLDAYEALLETDDDEIWGWITGRGRPPAKHDTEVTQMLLAFRYQPR